MLLALVGTMATSLAALAVSPAPSPGGDANAGLTTVSLGVSSPSDRPNERIELLRVTLVEGEESGPLEFAGAWLVRVVSGELAVDLIEGPAEVVGTTGVLEIVAAASDATTIQSGEILRAGPDAVMAWANAGAGELELAAVVVLPLEADVTSEPETADDRNALFMEPVAKRIVVSGPGDTGGRYRLVVADRSGLVTGARVPTDQELLFLRQVGGDPDSVIRLGPIAFLPGGGRELLVRWLSTACGPRANIDIARDFSAIRVVDRTPGCDAAAVSYALVIRVRNAIPDPNAIDGVLVRKAP